MVQRHRDGGRCAYDVDHGYCPTGDGSAGGIQSTECHIDHHDGFPDSDTTRALSIEFNDTPLKTCYDQAAISSR
jgi:hypothetical protein